MDGTRDTVWQGAHPIRRHVFLWLHYAGGTFYHGLTWELDSSSTQVLSGEIPWQGECDTRVIWLKVKENKSPVRPACTALETVHWELMDRCWSWPQQRPIASETVILLGRFLYAMGRVAGGGTKRTIYFLVCVL